MLFTPENEVFGEERGEVIWVSKERGTVEDRLGVMQTSFEAISLTAQSSHLQMRKPQPKWTVISPRSESGRPQVRVELSELPLQCSTCHTELKGTRLERAASIS